MKTTFLGLVTAFVTAVTVTITVPVTVVAIGYPDAEARRARPKVAQPRKPTGEFVHWDRF